MLDQFYLVYRSILFADTFKFIIPYIPSNAYLVVQFEVTKGNYNYVGFKKIKILAD